MTLRFNSMSILFLILVLLTFTACTQNSEVSEGLNAPEENVNEEDVQDPADTVNEDAETETKVEDPAEAEEPAEAEKPEEENNETITDTGRYVGQVDNMHIEILISGVPEDKAAKTFIVSDEVKAKIEANEIREDDQIKFEYYLNEYDVGVIVKASEIEN